MDIRVFILYSKYNYGCKYNYGYNYGVYIIMDIIMEYIYNMNII